MLKEEKIIDEKFENQVTSMIKESIAEDNSFLLITINSENVSVIGKYSPNNLSNITLHLMKIIEAKYPELFTILLRKLLILRDSTLEITDQSNEL